MTGRMTPYKLLSVMILSLLLVLLAPLALPGASQTDSPLPAGNAVVFAQDPPPPPPPAPTAIPPGDDDDDDDDDGRPGQGYCPDGETSVPGGVDKPRFCRDNGHFPPVPDSVEDRWCGQIARFKMFIPIGFRYKVICQEEGASLPFGIRKIDYRLVSVLNNSDDQERHVHRPPLLWKLLNRADFAGPNDTVVVLRWNEEVEPAQWELIPGADNEDGTVDYLIDHTSLFAVGLSDNPDIGQSFAVPETVIPAGLPRTGQVSAAVPWGAGTLAVAGLAALAAAGLWRWRKQ